MGVRDGCAWSPTKEARLALLEDEKMLDEFKRCVSEGFSIRKIRDVFEEQGSPLKAYSDVDLIKLWRQFSNHEED